jgi:hypothetical protein
MCWWEIFGAFILGMGFMAIVVWIATLKAGSWD